ncbi:AI-2E family transporter [Scrofimicrobium sp. R131]|uniref:AI-2E family transporter n=1 Tax=Scrofimicrobium appendicitidis TaxID=3079930 RepID=A0AAU7VAM2_9ACTO
MSTQGNAHVPGPPPVSRALRVAAAWSWRLLVVIGLVAVILWILNPVRTAVISMLIALLLAVLLNPLVNWLQRRLKMGKTGAAVVGFLVGVLLILGIFSLVANQLISNSRSLVNQTLEGINEFLLWLNDTALGAENTGVSDLLDDFQTQLMSFLRDHSSTIASEALSIASSAAGLVASAIVVVFALFFLLKDGRSMWIWFVRTLPESAREQTHEAGIRGWVTLSSYVRTQVQVAAIDAIGIGLGAFFLGIPLAIPITVLVFFFSFIPIVGAFISGGIAVFIGLVNNGLTTAVIMLVVVLAVQQIEGNLLQPLLMSHAVSLHPLAVVLVVTIGSLVAGIPGALFAVPLLAFINSVVLYLHDHDPMPSLATDIDRPGGAPGTLAQQIENSYRSGTSTVKVLRRKSESESAESESAGSESAG